MTKNHENQPEQKPRGLWEVMRSQDDSQSHKGATDTPPSSPSEGDSQPSNLDATSDPSTSEGKGLWGMMGVAPPPASKAASEGVPPTLTTENEQYIATPDPRPAWFRGKATETNLEPEAESDSQIEDEQTVEESSPAGEEPESEFNGEASPHLEQPPIMVTPPQSPALSKYTQLKNKSGLSQGAMLSLAVGLLAVPLTLLAIKPEIWTRIPATIAGFGALALGLISFNEIQRSRGLRTGKGIAIAGMVLGTIAMFLGPLVIAPWSKSQNKAGRRQVAKEHLEAIGSALRRYHTQHNHFPPGGTYRAEESGERTPLHSWMTELLPYLNADSVYGDIQMDEPWNAPVNKSAYSQSIPAFLAGGVEETHNRSGYGLSHFAGLGGQVRVDGGQMANVGIFDGSAQITQHDISDGLSQTLIAGEIPEGYHPWGEPGNWREIGSGLNQNTTSFGNAQRTGAMFLKADGSVQFFSNRVSPEILKSLSTRDGEDNQTIPTKYK